MPAGVSNRLAGERCNRPINLRAGELRGASAELSWDYELGAAAYHVQVYLGAGHPADVLIAEVFPVAKSVTITGLHPAQNYTFKVRALGGGSGDSEWSDYQAFNSGTLYFAPPTRIVIRPLGGGNVLISWNAVPRASAYTVEVERISFRPQHIASIDVRQTHLLLSDMEAGGRYRVRVAAAGPRGEGAWPEWITFLYEPPLPYTVEEK